MDQTHEDPGSLEKVMPIAFAHVFTVGSFKSTVYGHHNSFNSAVICIYKRGRIRESLDSCRSPLAFSYYGFLTKSPRIT